MPDRRPLISILRRMRHHRLLTAVVLLLTLIAMGSMPLAQDIFGRAVQAVIDGEVVVATDRGLNTDAVWFWAALLLALTVIRAVVQYANQVLRVVLAVRILHRLRMALLRRLMHMDLAWHQERGAGGQVARTTRDIDKVTDFLFGGVFQGVEIGIMLLAATGLLWWYHWLLGLVPLLLLLATLPLINARARRLTRLDREADGAYDGVMQHLGESVRGIRALKAFNREDGQRLQFGQSLTDYLARQYRALAYGAIHFPLTQGIVALAHPWVLGIGAWLVASGELGVGQVVAAAFAVNTMIFRLDDLTRIMQVVADARSSAARIDETLSAEPAIGDGERPAPRGSLGLCLRGVDLRIGEQEVLAACDLTVAPGELVALVGATSSGKSSLCSLPSRLRDPDAGSVAVLDAAGEEQRVDACRLSDLRQRVQLAFQSSLCFSASVRDNLRLAAPDADDAACWVALRLAAADDFVAAMEHGLDQMVGEHGVTLSGGQRQRLCLARSILAEPGLLILDDALSALDSETEAAVGAALRTLPQRPGILLVTNRRSTLELVDRVCILEDGRIVETGTPAALLADSPRLRALMGLGEEAA